MLNRFIFAIYIVCISGSSFLSAEVTTCKYDFECGKEPCVQNACACAREFGPMIWDNVPAKDLVGLCATRKGAHHDGDKSFNSRGVFITAVHPHGHIELYYISGADSSDHQLAPSWDDDHWVRAPDSWCAEIKEYRELLSRQNHPLTWLSEVCRWLEGGLAVKTK